MTAVLEARKICKSFDSEGNNRIDVLKNIDVTIEEGEFVAVMGQS